MSPEQKLLTKWRSLPQDKQKEVLDFVEFLGLKNSANKIPLGGENVCSKFALRLLLLVNIY